MRDCRKAGLCALMAAGVTFLPLLASTTRASAASPSATRKVGTQLTELSGLLPFIGGLFGKSVAVSGRTVVVGMPWAKYSAGRAFVFAEKPTGWKQIAELKGSDTVAHDDFGFSVAISGTAAVVGADGKSNGTGRAYVFEA